MQFPYIVDDLKAPRRDCGTPRRQRPDRRDDVVSGRRPDKPVSPADEDDLAYFLSVLPPKTPVTTIGLGSNLIVRDGGVKGVVIRLGGRAFGAIEILDGPPVAGAAAPDQFVARAAAKAGVDGLAFLCGVPGSIGGALHMSAAADGGEIKDALIEARGVDRDGARRAFSKADTRSSYRESSPPEDVVFTAAVFRGRPGEPAAI